MLKFFKRVFWLGVFSFLAYWGWKLYERIRGAMKLGNSLPLFLKNTVGEKPSMTSNLTNNRLDLTLLFKQETLDKEPNLEQMVREYIEDFYPSVAGMNVRINIDVRDEDDVVEPQAEEEPVEENPASDEE
ncbi:MAG: hypothetical protein K8R90_10430 [Candidatus Cloacimonetes bacterium]|nr:hypothetical protein [Candidatus Cloacimonadota bacterium]